MMDKVTKNWVFNASDEKAVKNGCRFDEERAEHICDFFESQLVLYEGEFAGQPFKLMDWQREFLSRAFGWVKYSKEWDREGRRFRKCALWVPKKNGKSPLAAGVGLYMLTADGENGQKVFSVAKDGKQAKIVHTHAQEMVKRSPALSANCKINKSTGRIFYEPTTSFYDILSGDNITGQEGHNGGGLIVDEKHVVSGRLAKVLEYMGASRSEPIEFGVSTYGNTTGYGKVDSDYGKAVERGDVVDEAYLHKAYEIPDWANDEDCKTSKVWKICNPSWGVTIKESEIKASCERAQRSQTDWLHFQMYRLNKWLSGANPWLRNDEWAKNAENFELEDFLGKPVWLALDLSKTRDMSALTLMFKDDKPEEPVFYQFPFFWLPEQYAKDNCEKADFLGWAEEGYLELIEGSTVRQSFIKNKMTWVNENFDVQAISYDRTYAFDLITDFCEMELDWLPIEFGQSMSTYAGPTENFEAMLTEGRLKHNNHKVLNWQAGHCQVKQNDRGDKMPAKPKKDDFRKIDGIVTGVMALNLAYHNEAVAPVGSMYADEGAWIG